MSIKDLQVPFQLRTYRVTTVLVGALIFGIAALGLTGYFAPDSIRSLGPLFAIALVLMAVLAGAVLYAGHLSLKHEVRHAAMDFEHYLASTHLDYLTGAVTRSFFLTELKNRLRRLDEEPVAFVQIDMDHLKQLNDSSGHAAGDAALRHLATTIGKSLPEAIVGRLGGDEFGVIILGHDDVDAISTVLRQMLDALNVPIFISGRHVSLSASVGFAVAPRHASQTDDLMSKADLALYKGKKTGRNAVVAFEDDLHYDERQKRFIERELRAAVLMNELELHYQPIFASDGTTLRSYEALVRWNHPVRGMIPPSDFIPVAESSQIIDMLGDWVLKRACADFAALETPSVSVNVSPVQLRRPEFADRFIATLAKAGVAPHSIAVEITETVPLADEGIEMVNLERLKKLGTPIVIDDFGSGNASLSYLKRSFFDILKIDRSYVENVVSSRLDSLMIASICRVARATNMTVVAEGIETPDQMYTVATAGVTALQGFLLGRPQSLRAILAERRTPGTEHAA